MCQRCQCSSGATSSAISSQMGQCCSLATVLIFSDQHVSGTQLKQLSGVAALLRFPLPLEMLDELDGVEVDDDESNVLGDVHAATVLLMNLRLWMQEPPQPLRADMSGVVWGLVMSAVERVQCTEHVPQPKAVEREGNVEAARVFK